MVSRRKYLIIYIYTSSDTFNFLELLIYFEDNFIGRKMLRNRRSNPRYVIQMWNCFSRVDLELPRTNNAVEGWHNAFHVNIL